MLDVVDKDALVWIKALAMQFSQSKRIACKKASLEECIAHLRAEIQLQKILDTYSYFCDEITILNQKSQGILRLKFNLVAEVRSNFFLHFSFRDNFHRRIHQQHLDTPYAAVVVTSYALSNVSHPFSFSDVSHQLLINYTSSFSFTNQEWTSGHMISDLIVLVIITSVFLSSSQQTS